MNSQDIAKAIRAIVDDNEQLQLTNKANLAALEKVQAVNQQLRHELVEAYQNLSVTQSNLECVTDDLELYKKVKDELECDNNLLRHQVKNLSRALELQQSHNDYDLLQRQLRAAMDKLASIYEVLEK